MAKMIDAYRCAGDVWRKIPPYAGYRLGVDLAEGDDHMTTVIFKIVPDGQGQVLCVLLDIRTRAPRVIPDTLPF